MTRELTIRRAEPDFTFDLSGLPPKTLGDEPFSVAELATTQQAERADGERDQSEIPAWLRRIVPSTGAITFVLATSSGCTVGEAGRVTLEAVAVDPDACRNEASLAADERYRAAGPITRAFQVRPAD